ncbi:hypothetical protein LIER_39904 [Lithospermum erythrorhizon]|uniref:hAT-like transposase RNase-H fold domain-containing protein n=1 Tax=Lithospermum erythrorhizon TaxID=34254 RepID=A0AAV3QP98_LITER
MKREMTLVNRDGLDIIKPVIDKIGNGVRYLLNSKTMCKAFKKIVVELQLHGRMQVLDTKPRWNSTWLMLSTAYFYKDAWPRYVEENVAFTHYLPNAIDWERIYDICQFLEVFFDVTEIISGSYYPTVNLFLAELYRVKVLLDKHSQGSTKPHLQMLATEMKLKYDKYWTQNNILISIGAALDPRYDNLFIKLFIVTLNSCQ